ncbi:MAG TPA: NAD(P)H-binding protein [Candidatus Krumholzibacteria bacterium]|nr:NAD(P)H-binding protein [Candidatus Krumholzibacteria bacterium]
MKILVTGGTGFIGTALRRALKNNGHDVRLLVRTGSVDKVDPREGFEVVTGDIFDTHACLRAVAGCDAVVHLIGIRREIPHDGITYEAMHTEATYGIVDAARRAKVRRFIHMSAIGARPDAPSRYHRTRFEAEEIVRKAGMRWTIFRPSIVFGAGDEFHPLVADLVHRHVVPVIDGGKSEFQPIALQNVVEPMAHSVVMPETQGSVYEAGGPERIKFIEIIYKVARHYGVWPNTFSLSSLVAKPVVKFAQRFPSFPLSYEELLMLLEDNTCDPAEFVKTFGVTLETYEDKIPSLCPHIYELAEPTAHHA